ncbi:hypothetical protein [Acinetobacter bereziniae]|uniref:hypothetical protein n=1 Tax=Acinetobacter bereziniae TaxID=106648 RepID=UPI003AF54780
MEHQKFYQSYYDAGFFFPESILTTYALSLYTKPFVILSGISGTGKTKIAQLFDPDLDSEKTPVLDVKRSAKEKLIIRVPKVFDRFNFTQEQLSDILSPEECHEFFEKAEEFKNNKNDGNFTDIYVLNVTDKFGQFQLGLYGQRASNPLVRVRYKKSRKDKNGQGYDSEIHLKAHYQVGDVLELEKVSDRNFQVVSVNEQSVIQEYKNVHKAFLNRKCFLPVKSDWTDNSELFGFYNMIEQKYHVPYFLEFLLTASNNPEYPFYVILDEMNLSKVEHYFSDILSCLESRVLKNGKVQQEPIVLFSGLDELETNSESFEVIPSRIEIPMNLYITGTVNIDESTHMLSSKVIDRANIIEFNDVDLKVYAGAEWKDDKTGFVLSQDLDFLNISLASKEDYQNLEPEIQDTLSNVNSILKEHHLHFGYRVANEVARYINQVYVHVGTDNVVIKQALDFQFIQKIFPKLNGTYAVLEQPLKELLLYFSNTQEIYDIQPEVTDYPKTVSKLLRMYKSLSTKGHASFIE